MSFYEEEDGMAIPSSDSLYDLLQRLGSMAEFFPDEVDPYYRAKPYYDVAQAPKGGQDFMQQIIDLGDIRNNKTNETQLMSRNEDTRNDLFSQMEKELARGARGVGGSDSDFGDDFRDDYQNPQAAAYLQSRGGGKSGAPKGVGDYDFNNLNTFKDLLGADNPLVRKAQDLELYHEDPAKELRGDRFSSAKNPRIEALQSLIPLIFSFSRDKR